ncbi:aldo/keto reductase, partial [Prochlorococcus sp. AH-716-F13]|nr:aldo/keto reductase [Prochlorococcus sp. AH-716-F13]
AQFGMNYGITNIKGKIKQQEVKRILEIATKNDINFIDTAQSYGNSEKVIGMSLPENNSYNIISKLKKLPNNIDKEDLYEFLDNSLQNTLINLNKKNIDALLLHNSSDLYGENGDLLLSWINKKIEEKIIKRFGVSIYDYSEVENIPLKKIQIIQLPISLFDQRFIFNGTLEYLQNNDISIHARSIFLQGLILTDTEKLPSFLSNSFIENHQKFTNYCFNNKIKKLELAISFIKSIDYLESILIGIENEYQLKQIINVWGKCNQIRDNLNFKSWNMKNIYDIDPRKWPNA